MSTKHRLYLLLCVALLSGCHSYGFLVKRESELNCPTDIRKTVPWCAGEDAIFSCPCGPNEQFHGHKPTCWRLWQTSGAQWRDMHCEPLDSQAQVEFLGDLPVEQIPLPMEDPTETLTSSTSDSEKPEPDAENSSTDDSKSDDSEPAGAEENLPKPSEEEPKQFEAPQAEAPSNATSSQEHPKLPWEEDSAISSEPSLYSEPFVSPEPFVTSTLLQLPLHEYQEEIPSLPEKISLTNPSQQIVVQGQQEPLKQLPSVELAEAIVPLHLLPHLNDPLVRLTHAETIDSSTALLPVVQQTALTADSHKQSSLKEDREIGLKKEPAMHSQHGESSPSDIGFPTGEKAPKMSLLRFQDHKSPSPALEKPRNSASMFVR